MLQATTRYAEKTNAKGLPIVVVMHEEVRGAIYDNGEKATESQKQIVLVKDRYPMVDYWALGHIHKSQKIMPNAYYCGSPHQTKFGENDGKGVLVVELERGALPSTTLVPIKSKPLVQLEELPDPPPKNAYVQYKPRSIEARVKNLPPNIVYHPDIQMFKRSERKSAQLSTGLLDNLDVWLRDSGQRKKMRRRSWKLVKEMCGKLDPPIKVRIPKQYRRKDKR
jgi:DNA repair exonuclease SbcCD nuclease subunit